jgi:hypothetical protein
MPKRQLDALEHLQLCSVCDPAKEILTSEFSYLLFLFLLFGTNERIQNERIQNSLQREGNNRYRPPPSYLLFFGTLQNKLRLGVQMDGRPPIANRLSQSS